MLGEESKPVSRGFEYHSGSNTQFLSVKQIKELDQGQN
jgi:hypothetical protein